MADVDFKMNKAIFRTLRAMPEVGAMTRSAASSCASAANSMLDPDEGYRHEDFEVVALDGNGYVVRTKTDHARYSQNKNKTLTKTFHSIGG